MRTRTDCPLEPRLIRYADLVSMNIASVDAKTADATPAEHFTLIESDPCDPVAADASIALPHGFNLKAERRVGRGGRVGHICTAAEVLIVHTGRWRVTLGTGEGGSTGTDLVSGDVASIPLNRFRRWEQIDGEGGFLFIVQGLTTATGPDDRTAVLELVADDRRWVRDGRFIDYTSGIPRLRDAAGCHDQAAPGDALAPYHINAELIAPCERSALTVRGSTEAGIISPSGTRDGFARGAIGADWPHGFNLRWLVLQSGAYAPLHARAESEVILVQAGMLEVSWAAGAMMLGPGDVLSVPVGLPHAFRNTTSQPLQVFIVRGSDDPAMPQFDSMPTVDNGKTAVAAARN